MKCNRCVRHWVFNKYIVWEAKRKNWKNEADYARLSKDLMKEHRNGKLMLRNHFYQFKSFILFFFTSFSSSCGDECVRVFVLSTIDWGWCLKFPFFFVLIHSTQKELNSSNLPSPNVSNAFIIHTIDLGWRCEKENYPCRTNMSHCDSMVNNDHTVKMANEKKANWWNDMMTIG